MSVQRLWFIEKLIAQYFVVYAYYSVLCVLCSVSCTVILVLIFSIFFINCVKKISESILTRARSETRKCYYSQNLFYKTMENLIKCFLTGGICLFKSLWHISFCLLFCVMRSVFRSLKTCLLQPLKCSSGKVA